MDKINKLLNTNELASYLNIEPVTVRRKVARGEIPATKVGKHYRFDKEQIERWLSEKAVGKLLHILVIDDEPVVLQIFRDCLNSNRYHLSTASSSQDALKLIGERRFTLIFLDLIMPVQDGAELFRCIKDMDAQVPVVIITGYPDSEVMDRAMKYGPFLVMKKPFGSEDILKVVRDLIDRNIG